MTVDEVGRDFLRGPAHDDAWRAQKGFSENAQRRAALYRDKAEEARTIAEGMGDTRVRATVLDVAKAWDRLADAEEKDRPGPT